MRLKKLLTIFHGYSLFHTGSIALIFFIVSSFVSSSDSAVLFVPSNGVSTISECLVKARSGDTIIVRPGEYKEKIQLKTNITLISEELFKAVIDGKGRGEVVTLTYRSTISGFNICNGNIGVVSRGPENIIQKCKIYKNRGSGILCMGNLPRIENNTLVFNNGSGIQAVDISSGTTSINHNTIAFNENNGILYSGAIEVTIENNIIALNGSLGVKTEGVDAKIKITNNVFFNNRSLKVEIPADNFAFDPLFAAPKAKNLDFSLKSDSPAINRASDGANIGAL
ncbi:MAG: right-handed parallel beta-helix repeat-containing protein [Chitinivibrionales bacterium]|nr:right-handed parallel beta-helix repeat-containing protein [Chitinivibrionales bacterium]